MSTADETFFYAPLQPGQIRVLLPHIQADGQVHWSLAVEQLLNPSGNRTSLEYDALSYTWGDSSPKATKFPVVCNDQQLLVHHNLNTALPFLARRSSPLPIWIDAVCINQSDNDEKFHQIQMMLQIYQCAAQVWVWLGPGNDQSGTVVARLHELPVETDDDIKNQTAIFKNNQKVPWLNSSETWSSFYDLVDNAWYTRLWVFQEVAFAKNVRVLLGAHEVEWATLKTVVRGSQSGWLFVGHDGKRIRRVNKYAYEIFMTRLLGQRALEEGSPMQPFAVARVVSATMRAHCYDRRDRVFALLGFVPLQVSQNMSWQELYTQLAQWILSSVDSTSHRWWDFLHSAESAHKLNGLPSWCPDFHDVEGRRINYGTRTSFSASPSRGKTDKDPELRSGELVLRGWLFDEVERVFDWYGASNGFEEMKLVHRWIEETEAQVCSHLLTKEIEVRTYSDNDSMKAAYWDTLNTSLTDVDVPPVVFQTIDDLKSSWGQVTRQIETLA